MSLKNKISKIWIEKIKKLDSKNHLVHGEIYARDGSVHDMDISDNTVRAKVDGAPGDVYDVEINFSKLTKNEIDSILDYVYKNPIVYSQLINNQIPDKLLELNVKLLPTSLKDFKMKCSCNRGLFCKHKAAVFHRLKNEIRKNQFLIFSLRGLNLKSEIQTHESPIPTVRDVLTNDRKAVLNNSDEMDYLDNLNFMLADYPSFYDSSHENFNEIIHMTLKSMTRCINQIQNPVVKDDFQEYIVLGNTLRSFEYFSSKSHAEIQKAFEDKWMNPQHWSDYKLNINGDYDIDDIFVGKAGIHFRTSNFKLLFFAFFAELNQIDIDEYCRDIQFLYEVYLFTARLIEMNALIPEFFRLENDYYHIRWIPAYEVGIFFKLKKLYEKCPENMLTFKNETLSRQNQVIALISLFFEGFAQYYTKKFIPYRLANYTMETYFRLFFMTSQELRGFKYDGKELEINSWLSVLNLKQQEYNIILEVIQSDFEFILDFKVEIDGEDYSIPDVLSKRKREVIQDIANVQSMFEKFDFEYDFTDPRPLNLREYSFFEDVIAQRLKTIGISVKLPKEFVNVEKARLILDADIKTPESSLSLDDLVDFDWKIAIGDEIISIEEFQTFAKNYRGLVKIRDRYVNISQEDLNRLTRDISRIPDEKTKTHLIQYLLSSDSDTVEIDSKLDNLLEEVLKIEDVKLPESLKGDLRAYQKTGVSWLIQNMQLGFGSILADDMGLGKTLQLLATVLYFKENDLMGDGKVLVAVPTSILSNWAMEIKKFTPSLKSRIYHGINRHLPEDDFDILLTSYGVLRQDYEDLNEYDWFLFVVDEAQNIKNPKTKQTKAVKSIDAAHHIALSGTPVENHLSEYWSIFDFTNKGYLHSLKQFRTRFINPIEKNRDEDVLDDFKKITSPFILRRLKTDKNIIRDLPDKIINDVYCNLTVKQASMYEETLNQLIGDVEKSKGIQRKGLVLKLITALKQICNHPAHFSKSDKFKVSESGKTEVLMNILENVLESNEKVLIFTQYVGMGDILKELIEQEFDEEVMFLHGGIPRSKRDEMIDKFQNGDNRIFILSLKAGGIGLNLTAASNVIHYDLWWNPAVENQATDRAYRIGQTENVMVYRFITSGTLEERINQVLVEKRELVEMTIDSSESFITEMTNDELRTMLNLRSEE